MNTPSNPTSRFDLSSLAVATLVTAISSVVAVIAVRAIAVGLVTIPSTFTPLSKASSAISLTVFGVLAAAAACLLLNRVSDRPIATFRRVAPVALVVSFVPDVAIWAGHGYHHSAKASTVLPLMVMHVIVAALCLTLLPRLGSARSALRVASSAN